MKKLCFSLLVGIAVLTITGCSTSMNSNTLRSEEFMPSAYATTLSDLEVAEKKVMGQAKGKSSEKETLEKNAIADALKNGGDVLVGVNFFYEIKADIIDVIVIGYPAKYKNFRTAKSSESLLLDKSTNLVVEKIEKEREAK